MSTEDPTDQLSSAERWIIQTQGPNERRLGRVLHEEPGRIVVRFESGDEFEWTELPKSARPITPGSFEWRNENASEHELLIKQVRTEPAPLLAEVLRETRAPLTPDDFKRRLEAWRLIAVKGAKGPTNLPGWDDVWKTGRKGLVSDVHVVVDQLAKTYAWSDTPIEKAPASSRSSAPKGAGKAGGDVAAALRELASKGLTTSRKDEAKAQLRGAHGRRELSPSQAAAAMAAGAVVVGAIDWSAVQLGDQVPDGLVDTVFDLAARQGASAWILDQLTSSRSQLVVDAAERAVRAIPPGVTQRAAVDLLVSLQTQLGADRLSESRAAKAVEAVRSIQPVPTSETLVVLLDLLADVARRADRARWDQLVVQLFRALSGADHATLADCIVDRSDDVLVLLGERVNELALVDDTGRLVFLRALALGRPEVLSASGAMRLWDGLTGEALSSIVGADDALARMLTSRDRGLAELITVPTLHRHLAQASEREVVAVASWPEPLQLLVPLDDWLDALQRTSPSSGILRRALDHVEARAK
jgi:hypothetical protein